MILWAVKIQAENSGQPLLKEFTELVLPWQMIYSGWRLTSSGIQRLTQPSNPAVDIYRRPYRHTH